MDSSNFRIGNWVKINDNHFNEHYDLSYSLYKTNCFQISGWNDGSHIDGCKQISFYNIPCKIGGSVK